jgi:hypothetical protein
MGSGPYSSDALKPLTGPMNPITTYRIPVTLPKFQTAPTLTFLIFSGYRKQQPRYTCLSEAKALHSQTIWAERGDVFSGYCVRYGEL